MNLMIQLSSLNQKCVPSNFKKKLFEKVLYNLKYLLFIYIFYYYYLFIFSLSSNFSLNFVLMQQSK